MGTDIYSVGQVREGGTWRTVAVRVGGDGRDYNLFGMLGGSCGDPNIVPIGALRGVPEGAGLEPDRLGFCYAVQPKLAWGLGGERVEPVAGRDDRYYLRGMRPGRASWATLAELDEYVARVAPLRLMSGAGLPVPYARVSELSELRRALADLAEAHGAAPGDVRLVYWFD